MREPLSASPGIICGADIIVLRKVTAESTDYAQREYGVTPEQVAILEKATDRRYRRLKRSGELVTVTTEHSLRVELVESRLTWQL